MWWLLLLGTSIKASCCWASNGNLCSKSILYRPVLLAWNCDAQWRIQFLICACWKETPWAESHIIDLNLNCAGLWCLCCVVCILSRFVWFPRLCNPGKQSLECNNRGLFFGTLLLSTNEEDRPRSETALESYQPMGWRCGSDELISFLELKCRSAFSKFIIIYLFVCGGFP